MMTKILNKALLMVLMAIAIHSCAPKLSVRDADTSTPDHYLSSSDTLNSASTNWKQYFKDQNLVALIDTALDNNQELKIFFQEIEMVKNEVRARKGEYLPFVDVGAGARVDKVGRYTRNGALEANTEIEPDKEFPEPLSDLTFGASASWELDVWKKLRNAKKSALMRYLATQEGRNFLVTNLIAEIANSYYELLALDNQLAIIRQNIGIQNDALNIVRLQKQSAKVTELAVRRFEAQVLDTRSLQYRIQQEIIETENRLNFLLGRFPQPIPRDPSIFNEMAPDSIQAGIPMQLLENRPDIRQAELEVEAARLDVKVAKATFYPSLGIVAGLGYQSYNATHLVGTPESLIYSFGGDIVGPLVNRNAIKAMYYNANARQLQSVVNYEQTILNAYIEVANQLSNLSNLQSSYDLKAQQVQALNESIEISNTLFKSARADYMEVLLTQRDALETRFELIETKMHQMHAMVDIYRALGGGWK
ncbi:MAG: TolC family protein [Ekhidna sp.]|uniref:TolC family protein n=1 Tax=Ekhidna sp. TaxID=2608089 RepID=UPI0032EE35AB